MERFVDVNPLDLKVRWDMGEEKFFIGRRDHVEEDLVDAKFFDDPQRAEKYLLDVRAKLVADQDFLIDVIQRKIDNTFKGLPNQDYYDSENDSYIIWLENYISGSNGSYIPYIIAELFKINDLRGYREKDKSDYDSYIDFDFLDNYVGKVEKHLCEKLNLHGGTVYFGYLDYDGSWGMFYNVPTNVVIDEENWCESCNDEMCNCDCGAITVDNIEVPIELETAIGLLSNMYGVDLVNQAVEDYILKNKK